MANPGTINASNFFGGDKVEQYRQELVADGRIPGTKQNATPEERKEGLKLYRKNKIEFKTFVENVLKKKSAAGGGFDGGMRPTRALLPGTRTGSLVKYRPTISKEDLKTPPTSKEVTSQQVESGFDDILDKIDDLLKEVRDTGKFERAVADKDRKEKEKDKREQKEVKLEGIKNILAGPAQKILAPIQNVFQQIMDAIGKILFAKVGIKLIDWYSNPENAEKLHRIIKFFREHWLLIVGGLLLFGTRLNGLVMFFLRLGLKYVPKLIGLVGRMLAAAGKLALKLGGGALKMLGKAAPIARAALVSPAAKVIGLGAAVAGTALLANEVTGQRKAASVQAGNADRARRGKGAGVQGTDTGMDKTSSPGNIPTGTTGLLQVIRGGGLINSGNRTAGPLVSFNPTFAFSNGGAPLGTDTIPAMLSPGEFVMSRGAVQKFGVDTLAGMNASAGGTNKPKLLRGTLYAQGGGNVTRDKAKKTAPSSGTTNPSSSSGGSAIVAAAKNAVRTGKQGPARPPCASWERMVLGMAKHPAAKKRTMKGDLDPDGTAYNGENFAASFAGSDLGTVVRSQSSLLPGDIVLHKNTYGSFTPGAITHVSIASDKKGKILHQSTSGGPPKEGGIFNFAAAIRLGGKGVIGNYDEGGGGDFQTSPGSANIASGTSEESNINPIKYLADTYKLYQEVFGTTPSDMQKVNPAIGVPSPQVASATPNSGISNDIPKLGSIDPNNRSTIGMKAMYSIVQ